MLLLLLPVVLFPRTFTDLTVALDRREQMDPLGQYSVSRNKAASESEQRGLCSRGG